MLDPAFALIIAAVAVFGFGTGLVTGILMVRR